MENIILTGFMGTGKSSVGKILAERLGYRFIDIDEMIEAGSGFTVSEIFASHGEQHFRALETEMIKRLESERGVVVSTGGGAVINPENRRKMRSAGKVVNLSASAETIKKRLTGDVVRPLLQGDKSLEKINALIAEREPFYSDADIRIDTTAKKIEDIVSEILVWVKRAR
jgi:shikimate kinase